MLTPVRGFQLVIAVVGGILTVYPLYAEVNFWPTDNTYKNAYSHRYPGGPNPPPQPLVYKNTATVPKFKGLPTPISYVNTAHGSVPHLNPGDYLTVSEFYNGVSFKISNGDSVTLLGVDLPTAADFKFGDEHLQYQTLQYTSGTLTGRKFKLEFDGGVRDLQGNLLAYVIFQDGTCFNEKVISAGFGVAHTQFPYALMNRYKHLQAIAKGERKGLWKFQIE